MEWSCPLKCLPFSWASPDRPQATMSQGELNLATMSCERRISCPQHKWFLKLSQCEARRRGKKKLFWERLWMCSTAWYRAVSFCIDPKLLPHCSVPWPHVTSSSNSIQANGGTLLDDAVDYFSTARSRKRWPHIVVCQNLVSTCGNAADHKSNAVHSQDWLIFALFWRGVTMNTVCLDPTQACDAIASRHSSEHTFSAECWVSSLWPLSYQSLRLGFQAQFWWPESSCRMCSAGIGCPCASIRLYPMHQQAKWSSKHFLTVSGNHVLPQFVSQEKDRS